MAILKLKNEQQPERHLSDKQMRRVMALAEEQIFRHPDDIEDVHDKIDEYTIEVNFYTYADEISIKRDEEGIPMAYIFDADGNLLEPDTTLFVDRVQEMIEEANEILIAAFEQALRYEDDDDFGDYWL